MPTTSDEDEKPWLDTETKALKMVSDYTGLSFNEVIELDCYTFKVLVKDSFIEMMSKSEKGQEYLHSCWLILQTTPDKKSLRKHFGKGGT